MAVYKVPQDVEADDKLIGPFSFRQFIYLIVVAISMAAAWGLSQVFIPLAIIPLPIILFFAVLALPLRKDQPMETYLSAVVSFYFLKSRVRFWQPDGIFSFVTIIPPKDADRILTKNLNEDEATQRLGYLADLVDTHGWAIRGAGVASADTSISNDLYYESQQTPDMMDNSTPAAQALTQKLDDRAAGQRQVAIDSMQAASSQPLTSAPVTTPVAVPPQTTLTPAAEPTIQPVTPVAIANNTTPVEPTLPLATSKALTSATEQYIDKEASDAIAVATALAEDATHQQSVPIAKPITKSTPSTSVSTPDTGTMELTQKQADELSQQAGVTVATLAQQAERVAQKNKVLKNGDEVTISFR
ncbi:MAG: hypothetical protein JWN75_840 [Candidatus Saccharibacteria bacterium]|nr:hypothetical protein [Candidatus Saccharibacteria bacterium]